MSVRQEEVETQCKSSDHDDKDDADSAKGEDDALEEDDVFSNTRVICHGCFGRHFGKLSAYAECFQNKTIEMRNTITFK